LAHSAEKQHIRAAASQATTDLSSGCSYVCVLPRMPVFEFFNKDPYYDSIFDPVPCRSLGYGLLFWGILLFIPKDRRPRYSYRSLFLVRGFGAAGYFSQITLERRAVPLFWMGQREKKPDESLRSPGGKVVFGKNPSAAKYISSVSGVAIRLLVSIAWSAVSS
jgi:hypothetical protein